MTKLLRVALAAAVCLQTTGSSAAWMPGWPLIHIAPPPLPVAPGYVLPVDGLPNVLYVMDPNEPASTAALSGTTPGIQVDGSNNVLALTDPVSGIAVTHGYGEVSLATDAGLGKSYFHGDSASYHNAYDGLVYPTSAATILSSPSSQPWGCFMVMRQNAHAATNFLALEGSANVDWYMTGGTDGATIFGQNNGSAIASEASTSNTTLGQLQVVSVFTDGSKAYVNRGTANTAISGTGTIGGLSSVSKFEFLNNPQADVYHVECWDGWPGNAAFNTAVHFWESRFGITGDASTYSAGPASAIPPAVIDLAQTFTATPNMPVSDTPPVLASEASASNPGGTAPTLPDGLTLAAGATAVATYDFTPSGNVNTRTLLDKYMYYQGMYGNVTTNQYNCSNGYNGIEGDSWNACNGSGSNWGRVRTYAASNPNYQLMNFTTPGLNLSSLCALNDTNAGCGPNTIYNTLVRPTVQYQPGQIIEVDMQAGGGSSATQLFYQGVALYSGTEHTPGAGNAGSAYNNPVSGPPYYGGPITDQVCYNETDLGDNYYANSNQPAESQFKIGVVPVAGYISANGNLTMTSATYDTTGQKFGTAALSGGYGLSDVVEILNMSATYTIDAWEKTSITPANATVIAGQYQAGWIGMDASAHLIGVYGNTTSGVTLTSPSTYADGAWHFVREVFGPAGATLSVDGTVVATSASAFASVEAQQNLIYLFGVRNYTTTATYTSGGASSVSGDSTHTFPGEVDDAALWYSNVGAGQPATAVPGTSFAGTEDALLVGYHLSSNGYAARSHLCYRVGPHVVYAANGSHFIYHPVTSKTTGAGQTLPYLQLNGDTLNSKMHHLVVWKTNDGTHLTYFWWDGVLAMTEYYEESPYSPAYWIDVANQTMPSFAPATTNASAHYSDITNGGNPVNSPVSNTIARIRVIAGTVTSTSATDANGVTNYNNGGGSGDTINGLY